MPLNLKSTGGGGIILNPNPTPTDVTLNLPATAGTLATADTLAAPSGASLVGYLPAGSGAVATTVQRKLRERASVADKLSTDTPTSSEVLTALQAAIDTGARKIYITQDYTINGSVNLAANQTIDFDGGSLTVDAGTVAANGIMYGNAKANIKIIDPVIDASATAGIGGINLVDCPSARVNDGYLTKCNLNLQSSSTSTRMGYKVRGTVVDMDGWVTASSVYLSAVKGANLTDIEVFGGKEGFGVYNGCTNIKHSDCESYGHTQDGFVIIAGTHIQYSGCMAYSNGQSGFTTQRQTASTDTLKVSYSGCHAYSNTYDGFDLRGANSTPFNVDILITAVACHSYLNSSSGFYVVNAEGTSIVGCVAGNNGFAGFFINGSAGSQVVGCRSASNGSVEPVAERKAGILVADCANVSVSGCISSNSNGATQDYGVSFIGASTVDCSVAGGYYQNNTVAPMLLGPSGAAAYVSASAMQTTGSVWVNTITANTGAYDETGFGAPAHTRPKGSLFRRTDGGSGEVYVSNGAGSWTGI
jgi:hypothetical protein